MDLTPFLSSRFNAPCKQNYNQSIKTYVEMKLPFVKNDRLISFQLRKELIKKVNKLKHSFDTIDDYYFIPLLDDYANNGTIRQIHSIIDRIEFSDKTRQKEECPVCFEYYSKSNTYHPTDCRHLICGDCKDRCTKCPMCRREYVWL